VRIDAARAKVVVGPREALETSAAALRDVNWIGPGALADLPREGLKVFARARSTRPPVAARVLPRGANEAVVAFEAGEYGVSPGQACVFYEDQGPDARVLGGGFIAATQPSLPEVARYFSGVPPMSVENSATTRS